LRGELDGGGEGSQQDEDRSVHAILWLRKALPSLMPSAARFIEPMLLLRTDSLPSGPKWLYELKLDGFRAIAFRRKGVVHLRSRNDNDFNLRYPAVVKALARLPDDTVVDGEIVAFDEAGRPSFSALQNYGSAPGPVVYYVFDVMVLAGKDVTREPLETRREWLVNKVLPKLAEPVRYSAPLDAALPVLIQSVKAHGFEGLIAKRSTSVYEPGLRTGAWMKMRVNRGQEFVIGGYTRGTKTFDALVFGYYEGDRLIYAARTRNGFTPATRAQLSRKFKGLEIADCPFANLPEAKGGRWGQGLTKAKMAEVQWLKPVLVGQFEFLEWTGDHHLRHSKFVGLREDKRASDVVRE
jgi:bifunctional non-homologous end joining protein LigD